MAIELAVQTKRAINQALEADQGGRYRLLLKEAVQESITLDGDAFRDEGDPFRSHLGASLIGKECARELWYSFRWATLVKHEGRIVRLFNRGHLEEMRFVALLRLIGCKVWQYDQDRKQFRVAAHDGHFGGSLDSVIQGCPDLPDIPAILGEFKTHGSKSFDKLVKAGVREAKPEHYTQMNIYMGGYALPAALYCAVNKDNDDLHLEIVRFNPELNSRQIHRAGLIVHAERPPVKISSTPGWFGCKFCDHRLLCHSNAEPARNCRTCVHAKVGAEGQWFCHCPDEGAPAPEPLTKAEQLAACPQYRWIAM